MPNRIAALYGDYSGTEMMRAGLAVLDAVSQKMTSNFKSKLIPLAGNLLIKLVTPCLSKP